MISVIQSDESYMKDVFLSDPVYASMCDDSCPAEGRSLMATSLATIPGFFLKALVDGIPSGGWWLIWKGDKVEAHTALLGNCRGRRAIEATRQAIRWVFDNTGATAIISYAWSDSPAVAWLCKMVGMVRTHDEAWPNTRRGNPVSISYFEIQRETT